MRITLHSLLLASSLLAHTLAGQEAPETPQSAIQNPVLRDLLDPTCEAIFIAAHRGGYESEKRDEAPENSLANIENSILKGYELFETDIQRTRDGHFVIVHDPTIDRETNGEGSVAEMTLATIRSLKKRYRDGSLSSERVATLEEFLERGKNRTLFKADLKPGVSSHFPELMKIVTKENATDGILFRVPYSEADLFESFAQERTPMAKHTLMFKVSSQKQIDDIKNRFGSSTIEIKLNKNDPTNQRSLELIRYAKRAGFVVETHSEGSEDDWRKLRKAGVRIFHTGKPSKLQALFKGPNSSVSPSREPTDSPEE